VSIAIAQKNGPPHEQAGLSGSASVGAIAWWRKQLVAQLRKPDLAHDSRCFEIIDFNKRSTSVQACSNFALVL